MGRPLELDALFEEARVALVGAERARGGPRLLKAVLELAATVEALLLAELRARRQRLAQAA